MYLVYYGSSDDEIVNTTNKNNKQLNFSSLMM